MIDFSKKISILFMQKPEILENQREQVKRTIGKQFPEVEISFASCPEDVINGTKVDIIITPTVDWLSLALSRLTGYQWIHFLSAGVEKIWKMDFAKKDILITKSSGVNSIPMSEYALGAMLYFAKKVGHYIDQSQSKIWEREWLEELTGKTLVVLGLGHVGQAVAQKANAFGMRVLGMQRRPKDSQGVETVVSSNRIKKLLPQADYIVVSLPLTDSTCNFVNKDFFEFVKPGCVLIDISRGGVVSENDLIEALNNKTLHGAALDVFKIQPLPRDSTLWNRKNVLITPHVSGTTPFYIERALKIFIDNLVAIKETGEPVTKVDIKAKY